MKAAILIFAGLSLSVGCSEGDTQSTEMDAADAGVMDRRVDAGTDRQSAVDNGTIEATEIDARDLTDSGSNDGGAVQDDRVDMGSISNGRTGCGAAQSPVSGAYEMDVNGTVREYHIVLPDGYDSSRTHKLIFVWHGLGGSAEREVNRGFFGLLDQSDGSAIFVAGQGLSEPGVLNPDGSGRSGWLNRDGNDVSFARALLAKMRADYCIDDDRVFSTGWSFGGIMTNRLGCELKDELRAIAPVMGQGPEVWNQMDCSRLREEAECVDGQVAVWLSHGTADRTVPYCTGERSRDYWQGQNGCAADSTPSGDNGCVEYADCDPNNPVVWCQTDLGHLVPPFAAEEIWTFFQRF